MNTPIEANPISEFIDDAIAKEQGLIAFYVQHSRKQPEHVGFNFAIAYMHLLKAKGVKTIFLEEVPEAIEVYANLPIERRETFFSNIPQESHATIRLFFKLVDAAREHGIELIGVDTNEYLLQRNLAESATRRDEYMATQIKLLSAGRPFLMIARAIHTSLANVLAAKAFFVKPSVKVRPQHQSPANDRIFTSRWLFPTCPEAPGY